MAITDHDTVKGVIDWNNNVDNDITVIPGIELSAYSSIYPQIHITGYFPRTSNFEKIEEYLSDHVKEIRYFYNNCFIVELIVVKRFWRNYMKMEYPYPIQQLKKRQKTNIPVFLSLLSAY